jgi:hypothetical protein
MRRTAIERIDGKIVIRWPVMASAVAVGGAIAAVIGLLFSGASYYAVAVPIGLALVAHGILRSRWEGRRDRSDGRQGQKTGPR